MPHCEERYPPLPLVVTHAFSCYFCYSKSHMKETLQDGFIYRKVTSNPRPCALSPAWSLLSLSFQSGAVEVSICTSPPKTFLSRLMALFMMFVFFFKRHQNRSHFLTRAVLGNKDFLHKSRTAWWVCTITSKTYSHSWSIIYHPQNRIIVIVLP